MLISKDTPIARVLELDSEHVKQNYLKLARLGLAFTWPLVMVAILAAGFFAVVLLRK